MPKPVFMRVVSFLLVYLTINVSTFSQSNTPDLNAWVTNGAIRSIVSDGSTVYLGGNFTLVGPSVPYGIPLDPTTGLPNTTYPTPNATVRVAVPDGSGGWYIGGDFTSVGGQTRNRLARINSDGSLHDWNPNASGTVNTLAVSGSTVYVGGSFNGANSINGNTTRNRLAAVDTGTGIVTSWNPNASSTVNTLAVSGSTVYVGGAFTTMGGSTTRNRLAAIGTDGTLQSWNPNASLTVNTLAVSGSTVYVGGSFNGANSINGNTTRNRLAAVDAGTGVVTSWNPNATTGTVNCIVVDGATVYVGGTFTNIGGAARNRIAALYINTNTLNATSWNPDADGDINSLMVVGSTVYAGGVFANIGGKVRHRIAALDATADTATSWNPKAGNIVRAFAYYSGTIYAGGDFTIIGGELRNRLAAIDASTGQANAWNPNADNTVSALLLSGGVLYAGGSFGTVGGQTTRGMAAIDPSTAAVSSWDPNANNDVVSLAASGDTIFAGGNFTTIGGQSRNKLAALSATTGQALTSWDANVNGKVNAISVSGGKVYFGGQFTAVGTTPTTRNYLAAVNSSDGSLTSWNPNTNLEVFAITVYNGLVYVAGDCTTFTFGSTVHTRNKLAALHPSTAIPTSWDPNSNNTISAMALSGSMVYVGRGFTSIGGSTRQNAAGIYLNVNTNNAMPWYPKPDQFVYGITICSNKVFLAGGFTKVDGLIRSNLAVYPITSVSWGGSAGGNFSDAANWAPGIAPSASMDVSIPHGSPILDANHTVPSGKSLTLSGTGSLTIGAGKTLTIAGTADFGGKSVTFQSNANGTARLGPVTGTLSNATNVTTERYLTILTGTNRNGRAWRLLSVPLTGSGTLRNYFMGGRSGADLTISGNRSAQPSNLGTVVVGHNQPDASTATGAGYDWIGVANQASSLRFYQQNAGSGSFASSQVPDLTTTYSSADQGYMLFARGDRQQQYNGTGNASTTTLQATGTLKQGTINVSVAPLASAGYVLVGNPYLSVVDMEQVYNENTSVIDPTFYVWDANTDGNAYKQGGYRTVTRTGPGVWTSTGAGANPQYVESHSAFFVRPTSTGGTLQIKESHKVTGTPGIAPHSTNGQQPARLFINLEVADTAGRRLVDGAVAFFHEGYRESPGDPVDIPVMSNHLSQALALRQSGLRLSMEGRPWPTDTIRRSLALDMRALGDDVYELRLFTGTLQKEGFKAWLKDHYLHLDTELNLAGETLYPFRITGDPGIDSTRFEIQYRIVKSGTVGAATPEEMPSGGLMKLYPNPSRPSEARLSLDGLPTGRYQVRIHDMAGRVVHVQDIGHRTPRTAYGLMPEKRIAPGRYLLHVVGEDGRTVGTIPWWVR